MEVREHAAAARAARIVDAARAVVLAVDARRGQLARELGRQVRRRHVGERHARVIAERAREPRPRAPASAASRASAASIASRSRSPRGKPSAPSRSLHSTWTPRGSALDLDRARLAARVRDRDAARVAPHEVHARVRASDRARRRTHPDRAAAASSRTASPRDRSPGGGVASARWFVTAANRPSRAHREPGPSRQHVDTTGDPGAPSDSGGRVGRAYSSSRFAAITSGASATTSMRMAMVHIDEKSKPARVCYAPCM